MIQEFVDNFIANESKVREAFAAEFPGSYEAIVKVAVENVVDDATTYGQPDPRVIHCINDGDYQGTLLFLIPDNTYQPSNYWYVRVYYGSCSGCDTLEAIRDSGSYSETGSNQGQVDDLYTLALHVVQGLKVLD